MPVLACAAITTHSPGRDEPLRNWDSSSRRIRKVSAPPGIVRLYAVAPRVRTKHSHSRVRAATPVQTLSQHRRHLEPMSPETTAPTAFGLVDSECRDAPVRGPAPGGTRKLQGCRIPGSHM